MHRPLPLTRGDTVAVVAPASAPRDPEALQRGIDALETRGLRVELGRSTLSPFGYLAGTDPERLAEFNRYLRRDDVRALFCVRGGYGTLRLLPGLDYAAARHHPKLLVGYSDITALHLALFRHAGWTGLSGPMVAVEWGTMEDAVEQTFWELAQGTTGALLGPRGEPLVSVRPGSAEGLLLGGNLTIIARLVGTPFLPPLEGALLFIEEVGEQPYRLDGLLAQLRLAGILDRLGGLILGDFTDWEPPDDRPTLTPDDVFADYLADVPYPVARGLRYGHVPYKRTMPTGVRARLTVTDTDASLTLLEAVTG